MNYRVKPWTTVSFATETAEAVALTAPSQRWRVYAIVDDDWQFAAVACDLAIVTA